MTQAYFACIRLIVFNAQASDGIEHSQYHNSYVCEDSNPHVGDTQRTQDQADGLDCQRKYDVLVNVLGGGYAGQAGAIRHGIARALLQVDPDFRDSLKRAGLLTRDARMVERKKPGLKKARKASQFSKR